VTGFGDKACVGLLGGFIGEFSLFFMTLKKLSQDSK